MDACSAGGTPSSAQKPPEEVRRLAETEEVLGDGQLLHARRLRPLAVGRQLVEAQRRLGLRVRPEVEVVVEHPVPGPSLSRRGG